MERVGVRWVNNRDFVALPASRAVMVTPPVGEEQVSVNTITIGVDLAKYAFSIGVVTASGRVLQRREFKRDAFALWLAQ